MPLPYENSTSGERAVQDMQKILRGFGCNKFGHMLDWDKGELLIQYLGAAVGGGLERGTWGSQ